jgi:hypothetical protein
MRIRVHIERVDVLGSVPAGLREAEIGRAVESVIRARLAPGVPAATSGHHARLRAALPAVPTARTFGDSLGLAIATSLPVATQPRTQRR